MTTGASGVQPVKEEAIGVAYRTTVDFVERNTLRRLG